MFRKHSGTSHGYRGDSAINVVGDLLSCSLGYNFARYSSVSGYPNFPLAIFFFTELLLTIIIRDNMFLMILQLIAPVDRIKEWQAEIIPEEITPQDEVAYWST